MGYRDLGRLTRVLHGSLAFLALVSIVSGWSTWLELRLVQQIFAGAPLTQADLVANETRQMVVGILQLVGYLVSSVAFLQWTYWATRNAHSFGMSRPEFSPAWAVGWYFVPIASIWKPYQALRDTFRGSHPGHAMWTRAPRPPILGAWWALWLVTTILGNASLRLWAQIGTPQAIELSMRLDVGLALLELPLAFVVFLMSRMLYEWQSQKHEAQLAASTVAHVTLPTSSPRRTLITFATIQGVLVGGMIALILVAASLAAPEERTSTGISDQTVAGGMGEITAFIQEQWSGEDPPLTLFEVRARWTELGRGEFPFDPFDGLDYGYEQDGVGFRLWSSGPDGLVGTADDQIGEWTLP